MFFFGFVTWGSVGPRFPCACITISSAPSAIKVAALNAECGIKIENFLTRSLMSDTIRHATVLDPVRGEYCDEAGLIAEFRRHANKHYRELEKELGNKEPPDLYGGSYVVFKSEVEAES